MLLLLVGAANAALATVPLWQSLESIEQAALSYVQNMPMSENGRVESQIKALDQRLKLARCSVPLEAFLPSSTGVGVTRIVGVRCHKPKPWKVFVPISVSVHKPVVVANRPLMKGDTVTSEDVRIEERDITRLPRMYLTDLKQLRGRVLKRNVMEQAVITRAALDAEDIVKRGQKVTLMARNTKLNVRMRGEAMGTAALNERIRVKNLTSNRVVEGVVISRAEVLVDH